MIEYKDIINILIHEIKNPLTVIQGYSQLVEDKNISRILYLETNYINYIVNNISVFNKILNNQPIFLIFEEINLKEIIDDIILIYKNKYNNIVFESYINEDVFVNSDKDLLCVALYNIVENACKYTQKGKVSIKFQSNTIFIEDNGCGINKENLSKITQLYFRSNDMVKGTGIGLYLVNEICKKLDLALKIQSEINKGTLVELSFKN